NHGDFESRRGSELQFSDRFFRRVHRNDRRWSNAIAILAADFGVHGVEGTARAATDAGVSDGREGETERRVNDHEVDSDFIETLMQRPGRLYSGQVIGVVPGPPPCPAHVTVIPFPA